MTIAVITMSVTSKVNALKSWETGIKFGGMSIEMADHFWSIQCDCVGKQHSRKCIKRKFVFE